MYKRISCFRVFWLDYTVVMLSLKRLWSTSFYPSTGFVDVLVVKQGHIYQEVPRNQREIKK